MLNIEKETDRMREYIDDVDLCRRKVEQIDMENARYKVNGRMNVMTIAITIFILLCAILKAGDALKGIGVILGLGVIIGVLWIKLDVSYGYFYCIMGVGAIALGIFAFMEREEYDMLYPCLSLGLLMILQGFTVFHNMKLRKRIGVIAKELDDIV